MENENRVKNRKRGHGKIKLKKRDKVNNDELRTELVAYIESGTASERLGELFLALVDNYATLSKFSGYTFLDEMKSRAILFLLKYSTNYNPEVSKNAFSYCTQIAHNAFVQIIKREKKYAQNKKEHAEKMYRERNFFNHKDTLI